MKRALLGLCLSVPAACDIPVDDDPGLDIRPFRGSWTVEVDQPFDYGIVETIQIGGSEHNGNFANRGDVIVQFAESDRILIEARRFAVGRVASQAEEELDRLEVWAYRSGEVAPLAPDEMDFPQPCVGDEMWWPNECVIRMYYDGLVAPVRIGADLRVTLPLAYQGQVDVRTEDNDVDAEYQNRGDVCVEASHASVDVAIERGVAYMAAAAPTEEAPRGTLSFTGGAADVTLDVPAGVWTSIDVSYTDYTSDEYRRCFADFTLGDFAATTALFGEASSTIVGVAATPDPEPEGQPPLAVRASTEDCDVVGHTESPEDWVGQGNANAQETTVRGNITVCNDCVREPGCAALLPD